MKTNNKKQFAFPPEEEIQKVIKRFSDPNYDRVNIGLMPNASELDKTKYNICQSISRYKRINNLSEKELGKKIKISKEKLDHILFGRITNFSLDELVSYTEKLNGHMEVKINYDGKEASPRAC
jgi:predicted XRE-type DNA-binding protein